VTFTVTPVPILQRGESTLVANQVVTAGLWESGKSRDQRRLLRFERILANWRTAEGFGDLLTVLSGSCQVSRGFYSETSVNSRLRKSSCGATLAGPVSIAMQAPPADPASKPNRDHAECHLDIGHFPNGPLLVVLATYWVLTKPPDSGLDPPPLLLVQTCPAQFDCGRCFEFAPLGIGQ
jgi:hypothetical protein